MAREDLNPVEEARACARLVEELGLTREEVGLRIGRSRVAVEQPAAAARPARRGARDARARRPERGARPRAAAGRGPRRPPHARARGRRAAAGRCASSRSAPALPRAGPVRQAPRAASRGGHPDQRAAIGRSPTRSAGRWARDVKVRPGGARLSRRDGLRVARGGTRWRSPPRVRRGASARHRPASTLTSIAGRAISSVG